MCGIVRRPTRRKDLDPARFPNLAASAVRKIVTACEDVHIPHLATALVLSFADHMVGEQDFMIKSLPFALYENGERLVSKESVEAENAVMHLAMAGSVRRLINQELAAHGLMLELAHCCGIQMWETVHQEQANEISHTWNVWRADKLRSLRTEVTLSRDEFLRYAEAHFDKELVDRMHELAAAEMVAA